MNDLTTLKEYLPMIIPLAIIEVTLMISGLISVFRHQQYRFGNRILWIILILCVQPIGALLYFFVGKEAA